MSNRFRIYWGYYLTRSSHPFGFKLIPQTTTRGPLDDSMALQRTVAERQKLTRVEEPLGHPHISPASQGESMKCPPRKSSE